MFIVPGCSIETMSDWLAKQLCPYIPLTSWRLRCSRVYTHTNTCAHTHTRTHTQTHTTMYTYTYTHTHTQICVYVQRKILLRTNIVMHVPTFVDEFTPIESIKHKCVYSFKKHTKVSSRTYKYLYIYIYIYIYLSIYLYI